MIRKLKQFSQLLVSFIDKYYSLVLVTAVIGILLISAFWNIWWSGIEKKTAIVVLGGGLTHDGKIPIHTQLRLDRALVWYNQLQSLQENVKIITLSGGTTHKPNPKDTNGFVIWEASAAAKRLFEMGIEKEEDVYEENFSLDTIGNAYFLRAIHLLPGKFTKAIIITNNWHMDRTKSIFETVLTLPLSLPSDCEIQESISQKSKRNLLLFFISLFWRRPTLIELIFDPVEAGISDPGILSARVEREKQSLKSFNENLKKKWNTFHELYEWIFTEHDAYASKRLKKKRIVIDESVLKTY